MFSPMKMNLAGLFKRRRKEHIVQFTSQNFCCFCEFIFIPFLFMAILFTVSTTGFLFTGILGTYNAASMVFLLMEYILDWLLIFVLIVSYICFMLFYCSLEL
jgi:hypothetical protein